MEINKIHVIYIYIILYNVNFIYLHFGENCIYLKHASWYRPASKLRQICPSGRYQDAFTLLVPSCLTNLFDKQG